MYSCREWQDVLLNAMMLCVVSRMSIRCFTADCMLASTAPGCQLCNAAAVVEYWINIVCCMTKGIQAMEHCSTLYGWTVDLNNI